MEIDHLLIIIGNAIGCLITILHLVSVFFIKFTDYDNLFDTYESSPLFNFRLGDNCEDSGYIIFHTWKGATTKTPFKKKKKKEHFDETDIIKINKKMFCYDKKLYKDLLYNGQIIKKDETCEGQYLKDCGIIDTLEQHLCIKNEENCPLYDVGIGKKSDTINYINDYEANIYYNNNNYFNGQKIIGKLILNDGQPCYLLNEKLWRKFHDYENAKNHLKCDLEIFGKLNDERYENKGDISYKTIYQDNLSNDFKDSLIGEIKEEKVSLYKREFLGIDKKCDEKLSFSKKKYDKLIDSEDNEITLLLVEISVGGTALGYFLILSLIFGCSSNNTRKAIDIFFTHLLILCVVYFFLHFVSMMCHSVFIGRMNYYNIIYDCSDSITNEILKKEYDKTKKTSLLSIFNLVGDIIYIIYFIIVFIYNCLNLEEKEEEEKILKYRQNNYREVEINNKQTSDAICNSKDVGTVDNFNANPNS